MPRSLQLGSKQAHHHRKAIRESQLRNLTCRYGSCLVERHQLWSLTTDLLKVRQHILLVHLLVDVGHVDCASTQGALLLGAWQEVALDRNNGSLRGCDAQAMAAKQGPVQLQSLQCSRNPGWGSASLQLRP